MDGSFATRMKDRVRIDSPFIRVMALEGLLQQRYDELGGAAALGEPVEKTIGAMWRFADWALVVNPDHQRAYRIIGAIYAKWREVGGGFGYPQNDETATPDGIGRYNHFSNGASIYWTPSTGAHAIYGDIRARWAELGWERSYLGYPISDEVDFADGGRANEFQNGGIYWWGDTGAIDLRDVVVHYTGLYCFGETDWDQGSSADEPYLIIASTTPKSAAVVTTRIYDDVDDGESRPDLMELYRGRPYGINLGVALMEHDFGDPNRYREEVRQAVMAVHTAGTLALGLIPVVGPVVAAIAGPALGSLMPSVADALNDAFDWGDDRIGAATVTIGARQLVLLAARTANSEFSGIGFKVETPLISGSGASYKAYFGVVPA